ncbi:MAG: hypothetical protein R6T98_10720 [Desulfatiglandales bacterium]
MHNSYFLKEGGLFFVMVTEIFRFRKGLATIDGIGIISFLFFNPVLKEGLLGKDSMRIRCLTQIMQ